MKRILNSGAVLLLLVMMIPSAYAITLQEAKEQGLVGEQRDGYVGLVVRDASAEVEAIVDDVNRRRLQSYQQIARQNGIDVEQVAALAYERAVEATRSGHYIQSAGGSWQKK
jgi:uncharacterized protein YdbL (DUF1318 family)